MTTAVYLGHIGETLDYVLLEKLAEEVQLVFIGPVADRRFEKIRQHKNVTHLGEMAQPEAAKVLWKADVGIVPFVKTALTKHLNANKCYEYLACELPVVATRVFVPRNGLEQHIRMVSDHEHFIMAVKFPPPKLKAYSTFACANSWDIKAELFVGLIKALTSTPLPI